MARRRLAELELNLDREQGWIRGGSKSEVGPNFLWCEIDHHVCRMPLQHGLCLYTATGQDVGFRVQGLGLRVHSVRERFIQRLQVSVRDCVSCAIYPFSAAVFL